MKKQFPSRTAAHILCALFVLISTLGASAAPSAQAQAPAQQSGVITDTWAVQVQPDTDPDQLAAQMGAENLGQIGSLTGYYLFRIPGTDSDATAMADVFAASSQVLWFEQQVARQQSKRVPSDPLYPSQWHLADANVQAAWTAGYTGTGVNIAIVDDGLQHTHADLSTQYVPSGSWDYNGPPGTAYPYIGDNDPSPYASNLDFHGTSAGGVAAANDNNNLNSDSCGVGVAYDAGLSGIRLIAAGASDAEEADALNYAPNTNFIYSNSWGPVDNGATLLGPGPLTLAALQNGVTSGRNGKGSIYVWAAGNGLTADDNVNYDGYANSRFTIAVGAVGDDGIQSYYSEPGAAMLVTAPSSGNGTQTAITTTDLAGGAGYSTGDCTSTFGGTSSAAPLVSGVVALMLQANPNLGWRDVQYILARTAVKNDPTDADWVDNRADLNGGVSFPVNHKYGFGLVDAGAAVAMAKTWVNVPPATKIISTVRSVAQKIPSPDSINGVSDDIVINQDIDLEHVEIVFKSSLDPESTTGGARGDLKIVLTSPAGIDSILADVHDDFADNYSSWKFMTVRNWGESSVGTWTLKVTDSRGAGLSIFDSWQLILHGTGTGTVVDLGGDTTGVFRPSNGLLYLKNQNTSGFADVAINYGTGGDYPVVGDWDGNGTATIGIYRNGSFYLRNSNTLGFADLVIPFGTPGDQPVAGDWNGDGIDTIGVYSNGQFLLRNSNTAGPADMSFYLGNPGDVGIAGDWNGDGSDTTGVFRPSNGVIFLKNFNTSGFADVALNYGIGGDMPVTGDWDNDGIDTIGVYRNAQFLLRNSNTVGFADIVFALGIPGDMPISGNWDGIP